MRSCSCTSTPNQAALHIKHPILDRGELRAFHGRVTRITTCSYCLIKTYPYHKHEEKSGNEPIPPSSYVAFNKIKIDLVLELVIPHFPIKAKDILESANVMIDDPFLLLFSSTIRRAWNLYANIVGGVTEPVPEEQSAHRPEVVLHP